MVLMFYITTFGYIDFTIDVYPYIVNPFGSGWVTCNM